MSLDAMVWALKKAPVTDSTMHVVLLGLADHASPDGTGAYPSRETLAAYAKCSVRTVATKLKAMEEAGLILRGDQQMVAHHRPDRRPVVYDLNYDVQPLPAVENDVQNLHPVDPDEGNGVKSSVERGEIQRSNGVKRVAHEPSFKPTNNHVVVNSPEATAAAQQHHPGGGMPQSSRWMPSDAALRTAHESVTEMDIPLHITRYIIVKAEKKQEPTSSEWLKWLIADENKARALAKQQMAEQGRSSAWHRVAE